MAGHPFVGIALFFDDVRFEAGNKASFMGQYLGAMFVSDDMPPVDRLGILIQVRWPKNVRMERFEFRIDLPGGPSEGYSEIPVPSEPAFGDRPESPFSSAFLQFIAQVRTRPLQPGETVDVWIRANGNEIPAGRLYIEHVQGMPLPPALAAPTSPG